MKKYHINHREKRLERCRQWRRDNQEYAKEYRKEWLRNNLENWEEYIGKWRRNNPEYDKEYRKNNPEKFKQYREENQTEIKAQRIANKAFPIKQECNVTGCNELGERHHPNYEKPLKITWLCRNHHKKYHKNIQFQPALKLINKGVIL